MSEQDGPRTENRGQRRGPSRRSLLGLGCGAGMLLAGRGADVARGATGAPTSRHTGGGPHAVAGIGTSLAMADGALGANFNEKPGGTTPEVLDDLRTQWVRGCVAMPQLDTLQARDQRAIRALLSFAESGYGTVLSLKFPYRGRVLPQPGTSAMHAELARLDKFLEVALGKIDILIIGNEPFIEARVEDHAARLNPFYRAVAAHVIAERNRRRGAGCRTQLYMGALNRLDDPAWRTPAVDDWLAYVRSTPAIAGVDIHPHVVAIERAKVFTDYVLPRIRPRQRFLVTEFSLVHWWTQHWSDPVPVVYASRYRVPTGTMVWEAIRDAAAAPVSQQRWTDLLMNSPWFASRHDYLTNQVPQFRATGRLAVATYGSVQQPAIVRDIGPTKMPWLLNSLYANRVARPPQDSIAAHNPAFYEDFRALQPAPRTP
ncbi:hypothetical protein ACIQ6R_26980 [Streptomyces sp. NPDC096048]|uniref:hypothetical protein n=1 Tax=Streptomyces sp. NPDC096048 TaxID=3366072 RepID=UPI003820A551